MNILLLAEGDPESEDSWSGIPKRLIEAFRRKGHSVVGADTDLYGPSKWFAAARTLATSRKRWWVRYHLHRTPFRFRSRRAAQHIRRYGSDVDVILQIGATFEPLGHEDIPVLLYCDSNIEMATAGQDSGQSEASVLRETEIERIYSRERRIYEQAAGVMTMSERARASFVEGFGLPGKDVHTVHAGPNFDMDAIPDPPPNVHDRPSTVLFVGKQFQRKGGDLLLKAFSDVRRHHPEARLLIVGPPELEIEQSGVQCLGFLDKGTEDGWQAMARAYAEADVFCLPTRFEPFGIAYLEAMCFGVPCVGPRAWAVPEIIEHGETGYLYSPGNRRELASRLTALLDAPQEARQMGKAGRKRVLGYFTWEKTTERMMGVFEKVLNGSTGHKTPD